MSKQSEQKEKQGFRKGCPCCENCANFTCEIVKEIGYYSSQIWTREKKLRCTLGGFSVKKRSWCREHRFKENSEE